ncbi:hypothetical protein [Streptomyces sp. NBC_01789]|uniref:hypothetical protein n=1 Tax=Streptomyces sp. NBC_01789 TaxID=2975941 RepID=UPI0022577E26|nr:hypothetical protein [Streptomyces sp. NBC_01789]MCX4451627.1 hypothetical protein [Streptomyces sp. NBC_01789]
MDRNTINARQLPQIRAELVQWLQDPGEHGGPTAWSRGFDPQTAARELQAAKDSATALKAAELFSVSADMTRTAVSAGMALPAYRLHPEDLPATHGLLVWEVPATDAYDGSEQIGAPIIGVTWAVHGRGVHVRTWCHREEWITYMAKGDARAGLSDLSPAQVRVLRQQYPQAIVCMSTGFLPFGRLPGWLTDMPADTTTLSIAELEDHSRSANRQEQAERALVVTWLLMGQSLAREEHIPAPRSAARHIARINPNLLTATRYVQLRHHTVPAQGRGEHDSGRAYRHRWIVRGHWRNHYYPSRKDHRPIWIDQHLKGPDGAPILDPEKLVHVLRR